MGLSELCIRRPVFASVLMLALLLLGLMAYSRLSIREYPNIDEPVVSVTTDYRGASPEIIESQVTQPLEEVLSGIEGIDVMTSQSREGRSQISVRFRIDRDADSAAADVRDRVSRARDRLPEEADEPVIAKVEADAQPIIYLALSSDRQSQIDVTDYADRFVKDRLQNLPGVAEIRIFGARMPSMRIWLDRLRLAAYGLTPQEVEDALRRQNIEVPAGRIEGQEREFTVLAETDLRTAEQFNQLIIRDEGGYLVRLADVGRAELGARDERTITRYNGNPAVALGVVKQSTANPLEVSAAVKAELPRLIELMPQGMTINVGYDSSVFIERSIGNVFKVIVEAVTLVVVVIFLFLLSLRATLIPIVTIPISLIGAFIFMVVFGFSINTLTLLALVLAVGLVVDDAIVVLENISRHVEAGMRPRDAAIKGAREISFAVVAMTVTLAAVYAPIGFQTGRTGRLFTEFSWTLAGAVLISGFVALTLSPMMCAQLLRHQPKHGAVYHAIHGGLQALTRGYTSSLRFALSVRTAVVLAMLLVGGFAFVLLRGLPSELSPVEDRGIIVSIAIAPEGSTPDYTDRYVRQMEEIFRQTPFVERFFTVLGFSSVTQAIAFIGLEDWHDRPMPAKAVAGALFPKLFAIPGVLAFASNPPSLGQSPTEKPIQFVLQTSQPYDVLQRGVDAFVAEARGLSSLQNLDTDLKLNKPQLKVEIDREKAALMGIDVETIGRTVETMLGGRQITRFKREGKQYDVMVQLADVDRTNPDDLREIFVRTRDGAMVALSNLVTVRETVSPKELNHFNKLRSATITATPAPGFTLGQALVDLDRTLSELEASGSMPPGIVSDLFGQSREFRSSSGGLYLTFVLALAFIYLVLAAQFESWVDPLVILLTVPLGMTGALLALQLTGQTLNVYSQIGLVTLIGLISKHGILIVEFANQLQEQGRDKLAAVVEAATLRLRPILMTTAATVLGAVPLAISTGAGAESRQAIGWVVIGGMLLGTVLTLYVVPTAYMLLARRRRHHGSEEAAAPAPAE